MATLTKTNSHVEETVSSFERKPVTCSFSFAQGGGGRVREDLKERERGKERGVLVKEDLDKIREPVTCSFSFVQGEGGRVREDSKREREREECS